MKTLLTVHLLLLASVGWAQTHGGSTAADDPSPTSTPAAATQGEQAAPVATASTIILPSPTTAAPEPESVEVATTEAPQEIIEEAEATEDPGDAGGGEPTSPPSVQPAIPTLPSVDPEIEAAVASSTSQPQTTSSPAAESQENTTPAQEHTTENPLTTTTTTSSTTAELLTVAPQEQPPVPVSTSAPPEENGVSSTSSVTSTSTTVPTTTTTSTSGSEVAGVGSENNSSSTSGEESTEVSKHSTATPTQQGDNNNTQDAITVATTSTRPSTTVTTTTTTQFPSTTEPTNSTISPDLDAQIAGSGVCFGQTEVNTLVVVAVVVGVNLLAVVVTALCVHRIVSRRLTWDPPPIYYRRSARGGQGKPGGAQSGVNMASDTDCKAGEGQAGTHIPILITNEDGWCVPYTDQEGKKKKSKDKDTATSKDTGV